MNRVLFQELAGLSMLAIAAGCSKTSDSGQAQSTEQRLISASPEANAPLLDHGDGKDWPAFGRTYGEQHYSPLEQINEANVGKLGLVWSMDISQGNPVTVPVEVGGTLYFANGLSHVHAVEATTGKLLWEFDPKVSEVAGPTMRMGWGSRGIAYWDGKIYTATADGRLIAIDAKTGQQLWSSQTTEQHDGRYITGAPRVFDGKIIVGHGGADSSAVRGYVTAYDAESGAQLWRFYTVPGDPAKGFENKAMEAAAKTWSGKWWEMGGGGTVWNAFSYDAETDTVFVGVGNGAPWNWKVRSQGKGDNLYLCSIVALDAKTGAYKWHYQTNPGETWDYNAAMDMQLADLTIDGKLRKVLLQAPKNGFLYVLDRTNGKLISAEKIAKVTWASKIDLASGRPVEAPGARYPDGKPFEMWPSEFGAHSWMPSAYNEKSKLLFIPVIEKGEVWSDKGIDLKAWKRTPGFAVDGAAAPSMASLKDPLDGTSWLLAVDPATQKHVWKIKTAFGNGGGLMTSGGNLVFQGQMSGEFDAYSGKDGKKLWHFDAQTGVIAAPITYSVNGRQYVTVLAGVGTGAALISNQRPYVDYRTQPKRVLTFALGGTATLPAKPPAVLKAADDPEYKPNPALANAGAVVFGQRCAACHGMEAVSAGMAPDLRGSPVPAQGDAFFSIVHDGALVENGMPKFDNLDRPALDAARQYIRSRAADLRQGKK